MSAGGVPGMNSVKSALTVTAVILPSSSDRLATSTSIPSGSISRALNGLAGSETSTIVRKLSINNKGS